MGESIKQKVSLSWKVARGGWTYDVLRSSDQAGPFAPVASGLTRTQWSEDGLAFGHRYFYTVVGVGRNGVRGPQAAPISFQPVDDTIPAPWKGLDIGDVGAEGSDGFLNGVFTIHASGGDAWGSADAFHYVYQALNGDGTIIAHMARQEETNEWAKAGLMMRETLGMDSRNAFVFEAPGHGLVFQTRRNVGGGTSGTDGLASFAPSPWLKLTRRGNHFTASSSRDGSQWTEIGAAEIPMGKTIFIGLATLSHAKGSLNIATFDSVTTSNE